MKRILVIQTFRYGDLLQTTPALAALRERFPQARISVLVRPPFDEVLEGNPDVDEVIQWDPAPLQAALGPGPVVNRERMETMRSRMGPLVGRRFDAVYNLANDLPSAAVAGLLAQKYAVGLVLCGDGRYRVRGEWIEYLFVSSEARSLSAINLADIFLGACGGGTGHRPFLYVTRQHRAHAEALLSGLSGRGPVVALQAGASKEYKRWRPAYFAELAARLLAEGRPVVFLGSARERPLVEDILRWLAPGSPRPLNLAGRTTFGQLGAVLERCGLLISNDTAAIHVAAAVGTPSVILTFGPTSAWETAPYAPGHYVLEPLVACFPCKWSARCETMRCMDLISPEVVHRVASGALRDGGADGDALAVGRVALYRTDWMPDGLLGLRPLNRPPLVLRGLLRSVLRAWYRARLPQGEREAGAEWRPWIADLARWYRIADPEGLCALARRAAKDFDALGRLARLGAQAAGSLLLHAGRAAPPEAVRRLAGALGRLEERISASEANESLRMLAVHFRHAVRDMDPPGRSCMAEGGQEHAVKAHLLNYTTLAAACSYVQEALEEFARLGGSSSRPAPEVSLVEAGDRGE